MGSGHHSVHGRLENELGDWWIEISGTKISDEEMISHILKRQQGLTFIKEIKKYLPHDVQKDLLCEGHHVSIPRGIPGGYWDVIVPLKNCLDPDAAEIIIAKYFPGLYARLL